MRGGVAMRWTSRVLRRHRWLDYRKLKVFLASPIPASVTEAGFL
jgi:hypothetical protein